MASDPSYASARTYLKEAAEAFTRDILQDGHPPDLLAQVLIQVAYDTMTAHDSAEAAIDTLQAMADKARRFRMARKWAAPPDAASLPPPLPWPPPKPPPQEDARSQPRHRK